MVNVVHGIFVLKEVVLVLLLLLKFKVLATRRDPTILVVENACKGHTIRVVIAPRTHWLGICLWQTVVAT